MIKISLNICFILSLLLLCSFVWAQVESYGDIEVLSSDESGISFSYHVPELKTRKISLTKGSFDLVDIDKCVVLQESGSPRLPVKIISLGVPLGSQIEVIVSDIETVKYSLNIAPVPRIEKDQTVKVGYKYHYAPAMKVYAKDSFFPKKIVIVKPTMFLRNQRVVKLLIFPIQFNPQKKLAQFHKDITIRVNFIGGEKRKTKITIKDLFENIYRKTLLNYQQTKKWRRTRAERLFKPKENPFDYSDNWYKIKINQDGIYCITRADLSNAGITGDIYIDSIRIFNGGGRALPLDNDSAYSELKEIPLWIKDYGNSLFNENDSILFYAWACEGWDYDSTKKEFLYHSHPYDFYNIFWLNFQGGFPDSAKRMSEKDGSPGGGADFVPYESKSREHVESNNILKPYSIKYLYHTWYWVKDDYIQRSRFLPNLIAGETHRINIGEKSNIRH